MFRDLLWGASGCVCMQAHSDFLLVLQYLTLDCFLTIICNANMPVNPPFGGCKHGAKLIRPESHKTWIAHASTKISRKCNSAQWLSGFGRVTSRARRQFYFPSVRSSLRAGSVSSLSPGCVRTVVAICPPPAPLLLRLPAGPPGMCSSGGQAR